MGSEISEPKLELRPNRGTMSYSIHYSLLGSLRKRLWEEKLATEVNFTIMAVTLRLWAFIILILKDVLSRLAQREGTG